MHLHRYLICIIISVNRVLKQCRQHMWLNGIISEHNSFFVNFLFHCVGLLHLCLSFSRIQTQMKRNLSVPSELFLELSPSPGYLRLLIHLQLDPFQIKGWHQATCTLYAILSIALGKNKIVRDWEEKWVSWHSFFCVSSKDKGCFIFVLFKAK